MDISQIDLVPFEITRPVRAIICFGPPTIATGMKAGDFFEVVLDPNMGSPGGDFIRFDSSLQRTGEVFGWQRVASITICEILGEHTYTWDKPPENYTVDPKASLVMLKVKAWPS